MLGALMCGGGFCGFLMAKARICEELTELFLLNPAAQQAARSLDVCVCVSVCVSVSVCVCVFSNVCAVARLHNFLGVTAWMFCQMSASQP